MRTLAAAEQANSEQASLRSSLRAAAVYFAFGAAWILLSDWLVDTLAPSELWVSRLQSIKGLVFVGLSTALIGTIVYRQLRMRAAVMEDVIDRERLLERIINETPELICRFEPDGTILHVNEAYATYFDRSADELPGRNLLDLVDPGERETLAQSFRSLTASDPLRVMEHRVVKADGTTRWQRWTNRAIFGEDGNVTEIQSIGRDITAEVEAREARERALQAVSSFMDALPGNVILADTEGRILFLNRTATTTFGGGAHPPSGQTLRHLFEAASADAVEAAAREVLAGGEPVRMSVRGHCGDAAPHELDAFVFPVQGSENDARVGVYAYDVTQSHMLERKLDLLTRRFGTIFDLAGEGMVVFEIGVDSSLGRLVVVNKALTQMIGYTREELESIDVWSLLPPHEHARVAENTAKFVERGELVAEYECVRKDGRVIPVEVSSKLFEDGSRKFAFAIVRDITERTRAQRQLKTSEHELREAQALAKIGSWVIDMRTGETLHASEEMCRLFDTTLDGMRAFDDRLKLVHPDDRERVRDNLRSWTEGRYEVQYRAIVNGELRWMHSRADVVKDEESGQLFGHGTTQDVTELKRAEQEVQQTQSRLDSIVKAVPVGIGTVEDDVITWASEGLARITRRSVEELVGQTLGTVLSEVDLRAFDALLARSDDAHRLDALQARILTGDRTRRWVQIGVAPLDGGSACSFTMADITELREAEERLRELSAAVENAPVSIFITELDGTIVYVNPYIEKVTGYTAEELIGQNPRIFKSGETPAEVYRALWGALTSAQSWHGEFHNRRKNGELFWERATISPILRESDGTPFRYIAIKQDITQIKRDEEELRRYRDELEELVRARTAEVVEARNVAVEADRMKSTFLASVSHELRTPLTSVIGFGEVLQEQSYGTLNEKQAEYVDYILASGKQLLAIINDILDLSKLDAGRMALDCRQVTLPALIAKCIETVSATVPQKTVALRDDIDQNLWLTGVVVDEKKLRQALLNLLSNAVKFTPDGGEIVVRAALDGGTIRMTVSDTGQGIPQEHLESIFDQFRQLNEDQFRHSKGTGLGLSLTRRIVELHGGRVWAESDGLGQGAAFHIEMPLERQTAAASN